MQPNAPPPFNGLRADSFTSLLRAVGGLRNTRALIAWLGCAIVGVLCVGVLSLLGTFGTLLGMLIFMVALGTGVNAAGLLQMDQARGAPLRSLANALIYGLTCIPRLIVLGLAFFAVTTVFFLALALVLAICKIPFIGPVLYAFVLPFAIVATGVLLTAVFACMLLSLPAIWEGSPIARALTQTFAIARSRLVETLLLLVVVGVLCFVVAMIVFGVLFNGLVPVIALSTRILGGGGGDAVGGGLADFANNMLQGSGSGYAIAGGIGFGVLWSAAGALVGQVYLQGLNLVYLRVTEGLDLGAAEAALQRTLDEARRKGGDLAAKARAATATVPAGEPSAVDARAAAAAAAAASAAAAYGGYSNPRPAYSPPPMAPPAVMPAAPSSMASPPAYSAPPATRPSFEFAPPPATPDGTSMSAGTPPAIDPPDAARPSGHAGSSLIDLPIGKSGAASTTAPLDIEFDFDLPTAPVAPTVPPLPSMSSPSELSASATSTCAKCLSQASRDDVFCGVCGNRLK